MELDEEAELEMRNTAIELYMCNLKMLNIHKRMLQLWKKHVENLKSILENKQDELRLTEHIINIGANRAEFVGEVVKPLEQDRFAVKVSGVSCIVNCSNKVDKSKLVPGTRVTLNRQTFTIMRILPPKVNLSVCNMVYRGRGDVQYSELGGLSDQIRDLLDWIERPLTHPGIFERVGVKPPKGVLLYGAPGTGKTLLARAIASNINATFLTVVSSSLVSKYLGDSPLLVREMFNYARDHQPCIIFMDEIDAIGRGRSNQENGDCDRILIELLSQLDGFDELDKVKVIFATNKPDVLDPALIRPGRIDKKIEVPLPNQDSRLRILQIHASGITKQGEIEYERVANYMRDSMELICVTYVPKQGC